MDIRFLIVGAPFIFAFFYTLFWLKKWGAFDSPDDKYPKKIVKILSNIDILSFLNSNL